MHYANVDKGKLHTKGNSTKNLILNIQYICTSEEFEDTKGVIRIRIPKKNRQHNDPKEKGLSDKQRSTKHYT